MHPPRAVSEIGRHEDFDSAWAGVSEIPARLPELLKSRKSRPRYPFRQSLHIEAIATSMSLPAIWAAAVARSQFAAVQVSDRSGAASGEFSTAIRVYPNGSAGPNPWVLPQVRTEVVLRIFAEPMKGDGSACHWLPGLKRGLPAPFMRAATGASANAGVGPARYVRRVLRRTGGGG
jgi:hypothetical protein